MVYIAAALRNEVETRAKGRCEYCMTQRKIVINMEVDHIKPVVEGGKTESDNLCLACISCNGSKQDATTGIDLFTETEHPIFNPRTQTWSEHFAWSDDNTKITGLTPIGRVTVERLNMNRPEHRNKRLPP